MFEAELTDEYVNEKFASLQKHTANVANLEMIMTKQVATIKQMATSNNTFKDTTRSIFNQQHHYYSESCRIVNVHQDVSTMYTKYV